MRKLMLLLLAVPLWAQAQAPYGRMQFLLQNAQGQAISGATINVYTQPACGQATTGTLASLFADANHTSPITQPLSTDGFGQAFSYLDQGCYTVVYSSPFTGTQTYPDQIPNAGNGCSSPGSNVIPKGAASGEGCAATALSDDGTTVTGTEPIAAPQFNLPSPGLPLHAPVFNPNGSLGFDAGYMPQWAGAVPTPQTTLTMGTWAQSTHPTSQLSQGDSITAGDVTQCPTRTLCYVGRIATAAGTSGALTNPAVGGDTTADSIWRQFNAGYFPSATQLSTIQIGTNDIFAGGAGVARNFSPANFAFEPDLISEWQMQNEFNSIAPANWQPGSVCAGQGSFTTDTYYAGITGGKSTTNADVCSFAPFQSPLGGEPIAVFYRVWQPAVANGGKIQIDLMHSSTGSGGPYTKVNGNQIASTTTAAPLVFGNVTAPNNTSTVFSSVFGNATSQSTGTSITQGDWYRIDITVTSATSSSNVVSILGMGFGASWSNQDPSTYPIQFWRFNIPQTKGAAQYGFLGQLNADLKSAVLNDQANGWTVDYVDTTPCLTGDYSQYVADPSNTHHPNQDVGHLALANCALYGHTLRVQPIITSVAPQPLNANGGTIIGNVAIGTASALGALTDNLGTVAIAPRGGIMPTGMLLQFDATKTSTYPPHAGAQFVGPGVSGNGHYMDEIVSWYDSGAAAVYTQTWKTNYFAAATPTPTAFQKSFTCASTAPGGCLPYQVSSTFPAGTTVSATGVTSWTIDGQLKTTKAGAVSTPAVSVTGAPFTGGSGTGTVPLHYMNAGASPTTWSTAGTEFGINAPTGYTGNFTDFHVDGGASVYKVNSAGNITTSGTINSSSIVSTGSLTLAAGRKGTFVCTGGGTITISNANEALTSDVVISLNTAGGTITTPPAMKTVTAATGFTVLCGATDTSTYNYNILN